MNERCLVFFSGGKDSFITTTLMLEQGYDVVLICFHNGSLINSENVLHSIKRLQERYDNNRVHWAGFCPTAGCCNSIRHKSYTTPIRDLIGGYSSVNFSQINCLCCQSAMWACGIAYAVARKITVLSTGYVSDDEFCTGVSEWRDAMTKIAKCYGVNVKFPVLNIKNYNEVKYNIMQKRGFSPTTFEPKCMLGAKPGCFDKGMAEEVFMYYDLNISSLIKPLIDEHIPIYKNIVLGKDKAYV